MYDNYTVSEIRPGDREGMKEVDQLLAREGIRRDKNLDYTCGLFDDDFNLVGTGSCFGSTLRCLAVSREHQGEGLLNQIVTELMQVEFSRGRTHLFVYTKCASAPFFRDLGFYELVRIEDQLVFLENRRDGFSRRLSEWKEETGAFLPADPGVPAKPGAVGAVVMNANPFTLGHRYLLEQAAGDCSLVHLFLLSEDESLVPFSVRKKLVLEGIADLKNVVYHESGPYIISSATFPSYFQKDEAAAIESHARLDLALFSRIAPALGITRRYVGEEPFSEVTGIYNRLMRETLPEYGIECRVIPRKEKAGSKEPISASTVRELLKEGRFDELTAFLPDSSLRFFKSPEAAPVLERIRAADQVRHY